MTTKRATAPARPKTAGSVLELVGGTPLVRLNRIPKPGGATVLAKDFNEPTTCKMKRPAEK